MSDLKSLSARLENSTAARVKFLSDLLTLLKDNGVNVDDANVLKSLHLDFDLADAAKFKKGLAASTVIITITA